MAVKPTKFLHSEIHAHAGDTVEVTLTGNAANVLLLDELNFHNYRQGQPYRYFGGHYTKSPVAIRAPQNGHWHVVVDPGPDGKVSISVKLIPGPRRPEK